MIPDAATQLLRDRFGFKQWRPNQKEAIDAAISGRDSVVLMPTGGGKSLCYQIPGLVRDGVGLVISPLKALMADQTRALEEVEIAASPLNSSQTYKEQQSTIDRLDKGRLKFLYIAPERLVQADTQRILQRTRLSIIAIDEAHCVSQWGHDFRPNYLELSQLAKLFPGVPRMAVTATATPETRSDIAKQLNLNSPQFFISNFDRPNIRYTVQEKPGQKMQLQKFLDEHRNEAGIIYCRTKKLTENTARWLQTRGFDAFPYHAGLPDQTRSENHRRFVDNEATVMVATIAFGMGIDKPDVRFVAHINLPRNIESYYQETGRAGRDGKPADAWMNYSYQDVIKLKFHLAESDSKDQRKLNERQKIDELLGWCETSECRRRPLLRYFGDQPHDECGNCDNCLSPPATWDGIEAAKNFFLAAHHTRLSEKFSFGKNHIIDVLRGKATDKVKLYKHDELAQVFGVGGEFSAQKWSSIARQLIVKNYMKAGDHGELSLNRKKCRALWEGKGTLKLREEKKKPVQRKQRERALDGQGVLSDEVTPLFEALRALRAELAKTRGVPAYVIFHDKTLMEMSTRLPNDRAEMLSINGVGPVKYENYGELFLEVILKHKDS